MEGVRNGRKQSVRTPPGIRSFPPSMNSRRLHVNNRASPYSYPRAMSRRRMSSSSRRQSRDYNRAARDPYSNPRDIPRNRAPSRRELELNAMRQRVAEMRNQMAYDSPYPNDAFESEELYNDSLSHSSGHSY